LGCSTTGALSSIPEFFTHIRDNLDALRELERQEEAEETLSKLSGVKINEYQHKDLPMRRGDYFNTDGRLSINSDEYGYSYHGNNEDEVSGTYIKYYISLNLYSFV